jgi:hypothetical protein
VWTICGIYPLIVSTFAGFRDTPWAVPDSGGKTVTFRGIKNMDGVLDFAMAHGMTNATEFVVTGGSAGGPVMCLARTAFDRNISPSPGISPPPCIRRHQNALCLSRPCGWVQNP